MSQNGSKLGNFLTGILIGGAIGYAAALLNAPRPGGETRQMLTERGRELRDRAMDTVQTTVDKTGKLVNEGREQVEKTVGVTRNRVEKRITDLKGRGEAVLTDVREHASDTIQRVAEKVEPDQSF